MARINNGASCASSKSGKDMPKKRFNTKRNKGAARRNERNDRTDRGESAVTETAGVGTSPNDVSWYSNVPGLVETAGRFAFANPLGAPNRLTLQYGQGKEFYGPGIMRLWYYPSIGYSWVDNSAADISARKLYSYVVHANSRNTKYDAPDLFMYTVAVAQAYALYSYLTTGYGICNYYSALNRYQAEAHLTAMGFNSQFFLNNQAGIAFYLQQMAYRLNSLFVPDSLDYFKRIAFMPAHVYMDSPLENSPHYVFVPGFFWKYQWHGVNQSSTLTPVPNTLYEVDSIDKLRGYVDPFIAALTNEQDIGIMAGDVLKAFGEEHMMKVMPMPIEYTVRPEYSLEMLVQIHNCTVCPGDRANSLTIGESANLDTFTVFQNIGSEDPTRSGAIMFAPKLKQTGKKATQPVGTAMIDAGFIDMPISNPTPADVMTATRLTAKCVYDESASTTATCPILNVDRMGTEIINSVSYYVYTADGLHNYAVDVNAGSSGGNFVQFKFAPILYPIKRGDTAQHDVVNGVGSALNNFAVLSRNDVAQLHNAAMLSLFDPKVGTVG